MTSEYLYLTEDLTPGMKLFAEDYVNHLSPTKAARVAFPDAKNHPQIGFQVIRNEKVARYVEYLRREQKNNMGVSVDRVLLELCRMAYVDPGDLYDEHGCLKNIKDMPEDVRRTISFVETKEMFEQEGKSKKYVGDQKKVKLTPKEKAIELLMRHLGMFERDNNQQATQVVIMNGNEGAEIWEQLQKEF